MVYDEQLRAEVRDRFQRAMQIAADSLFVAQSLAADVNDNKAVNLEWQVKELAEQVNVIRDVALIYTAQA